MTGPIRIRVCIAVCSNASRSALDTAVRNSQGTLLLACGLALTSVAKQSIGASLSRGASARTSSIFRAIGGPTGASRGQVVLPTAPWSTSVGASPVSSCAGQSAESSSCGALVGCIA